jgi:hypothetical protein
MTVEVPARGPRSAAGTDLVSLGARTSRPHRLESNAGRDARAPLRGVTRRSFIHTAYGAGGFDEPALRVKPDFRSLVRV